VWRPSQKGLDLNRLQRIKTGYSRTTETGAISAKVGVGGPEREEQDCLPHPGDGGHRKNGGAVRRGGVRSDQAAPCPDQSRSSSGPEVVPFQSDHNQPVRTVAAFALYEVTAGGTLEVKLFARKGRDEDGRSIPGDYRRSRAVASRTRRTSSFQLPLDDLENRAVWRPRAGVHPRLPEFQVWQ